MAAKSGTRTGWALCRGGHPGNKPFCDGTHLTIDFDGTLAN
jgi:CDGSH-type Zn-finger protein